MGLLDRLEQSIERLVEGTTGSFFRQKLQPVEIGKRLERTMLSQQRVSVDARIVPNAYIVRLNPKDYEQFEGFKSGLARELESWLADVASRHRLTMLDRISVALVEDDSISVRNPAVDAKISDQPRRTPKRPEAGRARSRRDTFEPSARPMMQPRSVDGTEVIGIRKVPESAHDRGTDLALRGTSGNLTGRTFPIREGNSTIGRSADNTVVIDAADVSRRHARLERTGQHLRIYDLNSTNGTRINGEGVHISDIQPGDEIRLGSQVFLVEANSNDSSHNHGSRW